MLRSVLHGLAARLVRRVPAGVAGEPVAAAAARELAWAVAGGVLFVAILQLPSSIATDNPDFSWIQVLAYLQVRGAQAGVDYVFPYGPLHQVLLAPYDPALFPFKFAAEVLFKLATAGLLVRLARQMPGPTGLVFLAVTVALHLALPLTQEVVTLAALPAAWLPVLKGRLTRLDAVLGPAYLAAAGLAKFTLVGVGLAELAVLTAFLLTRRPRWHAAVPPAVYALAAVVLGAAAGQHVGNLPAYYRGGLEYSAAYTEGLAIPGPRADVRLALIGFGLAAAAALAAGRAALTRSQALAGLALVALTAGLGWKLGFARHDAHALLTFVLALYLPTFVTLATPAGPRPELRRGLLAAATVAAGLGCYEVMAREGGFRSALAPSLVGEWQKKVHDLTHPADLRARLDATADALRKEYDLPAVRARVGAEPVDVLTESEGVVLLNGLTLAPRPTIQSVNAVGADMLRRNAAYFAGPAAPRFVLLRWASFDGRYPTLTDGPALLEVARRYRPVLEEKGYVLLDRRPEPVAAAPRAVLDRTAEFGDEIPIPPAADGGYQTVTFDIGYTAAGRLRMAAFRPPMVFLIVTDAAGAPKAYRLVPGMAACEFLLDPLCQTTAELGAFCGGKPGRRVASVRLFVEGRERMYVRPTAGVTVRAYPRLPD